MMFELLNRTLLVNISTSCNLFLTVQVLSMTCNFQLVHCLLYYLVIHLIPRIYEYIFGSFYSSFHIFFQKALVLFATLHILSFIYLSLLSSTPFNPFILATLLFLHINIFYSPFFEISSPLLKPLTLQLISLVICILAHNRKLKPNINT